MVTTSEAAEATKGEIGPGNGAGHNSTELFSNVAKLGDSVKSVGAELCTLVVLETRLTARRVSAIVLSALLVILVLTTMWFGASVALALLFISFGMPPAAAVLGVVLLHLLALPFLVLRIKKLSGTLGYPETRETVTKALDQLLERASARQ